MKRMHRIKRRIALGLLIGILLGLGGCSKSPDVGAMRIILVSKSSESNFWKTVYAGANAAANEYNIQVDFVSPKEEDDYETQNQCILQAIQDGYNGLVISACDYTKNTEAIEKAADSGMTVITIDSPIQSSKNFTMIGTDNEEAGRTAAKTMAELLEGKPAKVGIINFEEISGNGGQRQIGFEEEAKVSGMEIIDLRYAYSNVESPRDETLSMLDEHPEINGIVTFNEWTTLGVGTALASLPDARDKVVIGFDTNIRSIDDLENGVFDALVVQNPFAMGYLGITRAIEESQRKTFPDTINTGTTVITSENMYNPENQKLTFPFT